MKKNFAFCDKNVFAAIFSLSRKDKEAFNRRAWILQELSTASLSTGYRPDNNSETSLVYVSDCNTISEFLNCLQEALKDMSERDRINHPAITFAAEDHITIIHFHQGKVLDVSAFKGNDLTVQLFGTTRNLRGLLNARIVEDLVNKEHNENVPKVN